MASTLNTELLSSMIKTKRGKTGLRQTAEEIGGVSTATLSRIEQGNLPDVDTFIRLCHWLGESAETFVLLDENEQSSPNNKDRIIAHLRSDAQLKPETVKMLLNVIEIAYNL